MFDILRRYKISYELFNFFKKSKLKYNLPHYKKWGLKKYYFSSVSSEDFRGLESPKTIHDENDSSLELPKNDKFNSLDTSTKSQLLSWSKNGYVILRGFFTSADTTAINNEIDKLVKQKKAYWRYNNKIMFAINNSSLLKRIGTNKNLLSIIQLLLGKKVELFQSINTLLATEQRTHSDAIHMTTFPYGNLIAVWIALEDISDESGPLHYYPGSHKLPYILNRDFNNIGTRFTLGDREYSEYEDKIESIVKKHDLKKEVFLANKGDVIIWHSNLLHGGEPLLNKNKTRKSMILHYSSTDAVCFHEITQRPTLKPSL